LEQSKTEVEDRIKKLEEAAAILPQRSDAEVEDRLKKLEAWIDGENKWINSAKKKKKKKKDKDMSSSVELPAEEVGSSAQAEDLEEALSEKKNTTARKSTEDGSVEAQGVEEAAAEEGTPHQVEHY
jgi:ribosome-associated translation inhibitor RaiA